MSDVIPGGWTGFNFTIPPEAQKVFDAALHGFSGVDYTPIAVASQVVAGSNYCFLCKAKAVYPNAPEFVAKVYIYQPLQGAPHITHIERVQP